VIESHGFLDRQVPAVRSSPLPGSVTRLTSLETDRCILANMVKYRLQAVFQNLNVLLIFQSLVS
jgi:hypothetical protein